MFLFRPLGATQQLIRTLIQIKEILAPVPHERYLSMRLFYTKKTPPDYEPNFFRAATKDDEVVFGQGERTKIKLGQLFLIAILSKK